MKIIKTVSVILILILLSSLFLSVSASDIALENAIGVHNFDLSSGNNFNSTGSFIIRNDGDETSYIILTVESNLVSVDLDGDGNPRTHNHILLRDNVTFYPVPDITWIKLYKQRFDVEPHSSYLVEYEVVIPKNELSDFINSTNGYLVYIQIDGTGGQQVSCNYDAKIFFTFKGELAQPFMLPNFVLWFVAIAVIFGVISYIVIVSKKKSHSSTGPNDIYE